MDKAERAADMIHAEAKALEDRANIEHPGYVSNHEDRDYKRGKIDGLRLAEKLLAE